MGKNDMAQLNWKTAPEAGFPRRTTRSDTGETSRAAACRLVNLIQLRKHLPRAPRPADNAMPCEDDPCGFAGQEQDMEKDADSYKEHPEKLISLGMALSCGLLKEMQVLSLFGSLEPRRFLGLGEHHPRGSPSWLLGGRAHANQTSGPAQSENTLTSEPPLAR